MEYLAGYFDVNVNMSPLAKHHQYDKQITERFVAGWV